MCREDIYFSTSKTICTFLNTQPEDNLLNLNAAYAIYFDHRRRTDPEFRKALKRESRKEARAAKEEAEAQGAQQKRAIKAAVEEAREEGFPTNVEEKEAYFMSVVAKGETLCQDGMLDPPSLPGVLKVTDGEYSRGESDRSGIVLLPSSEGLSTAG